MLSNAAKVTSNETEKCFPPRAYRCKIARGQVDWYFVLNLSKLAVRSVDFLQEKEKVNLTWHLIAVYNYN